MLAALNLDPEEERCYIVVLVTPEGKATAGLSRPLHLDGTGEPNEPFDGSWGLLTEEEAQRLAGAWNADPRQPDVPGENAQVVEVYRFDADPDDPDGDQI
jgi:hypothetical protein